MRSFKLHAMSLLVCWGGLSVARALASESLSVSYDTVDGRLTVVDAESGRTWTSIPGEVCPTGVRVTHQIEDREVVVTLSADAEWEMHPLDFPRPFAAERGDRILLTQGNGFLFPADMTDLGTGAIDFSSYPTRDMEMACFGHLSETAGYLAIIETPEDCGQRYCVGPNGLRQPNVVWLPERGRFGYARRIRYVFFKDPTPMKMALRYREEMKRKGWYKLFPDKMQERPSLASRYAMLAGAPNVWFWELDGDKPGFARELKDLGFDTFLLQSANRRDLGVWITSEEVRAMAEVPGVLAGVYDIYRDFMDPENLPLIDCVRPYWPTNVWENGDYVLKADGSVARGWGVNRKGTIDAKNRIGCAQICEGRSWPYARANLTRDLKAAPHAVRLFDVVGGGLGECYNPRHPLTRRASRQARQEFFRNAENEFGILSGTEDGSECFVESCSYFEGTMSAPNHYRVDGGRYMWKIYEDVPDNVCRGTDPTTRVPFFDMVFHGCVNLYWYWCDYNNKFPQLWHRRDLFNFITGEPPMYFFTRESFAKQKGFLAASQALATRVAKATFGVPMSDYRWLSADRLVQQSTFENGVVATVNFGEQDFVMADGFVLPPGGSRLDRLPVAAEARQETPACEVYVDAGAEPDGDGSASRPYQTAEAAQAAVRARRAAGGIDPHQRVDVIFAPGDYRVEKSLVMDSRDSGSRADAPVVWRAAKDGTARFTGGIRVPVLDFAPVRDDAICSRLSEDVRDKVVVADVRALLGGQIPELNDSFAGAPNGPLLFVNHRHLPLARWPNVGFTSFVEVVDHGVKLKSSTTDASRDVFSPGAFVYSNSRARNWPFADGVWLCGYWTHDWSFYSVRADAYGVENGTNDVIRLKCGVPYGVKNKTWGRKERRFYAFNLLEELDAPGEWYLDRARGLLYLYPPEGVLKASDDVFLGTLTDPMLKVAPGGLRHFRFEGLVFEYMLGDGLKLNGEGICIDRCRVGCLGKCGISLTGDRHHVRDTEVFQCGTVGIFIGGGDRVKLVRADSTIEGCDIHDFGTYQRTYAPGIRLEGCGCTIRANRIHDAPHSACIYGGNEHLIEYNNVYRVLLETGDAGAYYTGRDWTSQGNVLRYNFTHELGRDGADASTMGFYFDDCDCGDEVYGNVFWKVSRGIMVGGGRDHPIRNNVFADCEIGISIDTRGMTWATWNRPGGSWDLEGKALRLGYTNMVWASRYPRLANIMSDSPREPLYNPVEHNIFYDCRRHLVALDGNTMTNALKRESYVGNLIINSCGTNGVKFAIPDARIAKGFKTLNGTAVCPDTFGFVNPESGDFRLRPDARILRETGGFRVIPFDQIPKAKGADR